MGTTWKGSTFFLSKTRPSFLVALTLLLVVSAGGCAKNVEQVNLDKWGYSFEPTDGSGQRIDTSAQGGASQNGIVPGSTNFAIPKASVGGAYYRRKSASANYQMTGGFHTR